jgi:hypothetical protein
MSDLSDETLSVFDHEAAALESGTLDVEEPVPRGHSIVDGAITIIEFVLRAEDVPFSFDPSLSGEVADLEDELREDDREPLADVLRVYQDLAGLYPDVLGFAYGGTPDDFFELRRTVVPELLAAATAWAEDRKDQTLAQRLSGSESLWTAALRNLSARPGE